MCPCSLYVFIMKVILFCPLLLLLLLIVLMLQSCPITSFGLAHCLWALMFLCTLLLLWPCVGLNMLIHASQPQEEDSWVIPLQNMLVTKQGCANYLGGACSHRLLRTHYTVLEGNQKNFRRVKGKTWMSCILTFITNMWLSFNAILYLFKFFKLNKF